MINNYINNQAQNMTTQLENRLQQTNPQMYQMYKTARQQNVDPNDMLKQVTRNFDSKTMKQFKEQAKKFGISDDLLNQI